MGARPNSAQMQACRGQQGQERPTPGQGRPDRPEEQVRVRPSPLSLPEPTSIYDSDASAFLCCPQLRFWSSLVAGNFHVDSGASHRIGDLLVPSLILYQHELRHITGDGGCGDAAGFWAEPLSLRRV
jgi:hypothetical protein